MSTAKERMVLAALDLLRHSGLTGAGINSVVEASGAPKGSVYHYFPGGKQDLVVAALGEAERRVGEGFRAIFAKRASLAEKVRALFATIASGLAARRFTRGCPVAAVTLDLDAESAPLQDVCSAVFTAWRDVIAAGLDDVPEAGRRDVAELILATLEGAMMLARAQSAQDPLLRVGTWLADALDAKFPPRPPDGDPARR